MTDDKYAELFPASGYVLAQQTPLFCAYAQTWLDSRIIVKGTRDNYRGTLNNYWMPFLGARRIDEISSADLRKIVAETDWTSVGVRRNATDKLSSVFKSAVADGLIARNPMASITRPKLQKKVVDPLTREEAEQVIAHLYQNLKGLVRVYACFFEFAFFTGMRPGEIMALRWNEVDMGAKSAHVCRVLVKGKIEERVKTKHNRHVLLNRQALNALREAMPLTKARSPYVFAPAVFPEDEPYIHTTSTTTDYFHDALKALKIRRRRQYDTRHTYATMCLMAGLNPAFIANQLGHSVQMLLSTYAKWLNSTSDFAELDKLENRQVGTTLVQAK